MIPLVKAIIVAVIVVGVGAPTAYVAYNYSQTSAIPITNFIPGDAMAVVHYQNGSLSVYAYAASNNTSAVLVDYSLSSFKSFFNTSTGSGFKAGSNVSINITALNYTYHGFTIYHVTGVSLNIGSIAGGFSPLNSSHTITSNFSSNTSYYVSPVESNNIVLGNISSIKASINAEVYGTYLKGGLKYLSESGTGIGFYVNLTSENMTGKSIFNTTIPSFVAYGNVSATTMNITITNINASFKSELGLMISSIGTISNGTISVVSSSSSSTSATYELSVGYLTFNADLSIILTNMFHGYGGSGPYP